MNYQNKLKEILDCENIVFTEGLFNEKIIKNGKIIEFENIICEKMKVSRCYKNSYLLYLSHKNPFYNKFGKLKLFIGYSLSDDGKWRKHSWCQNENNTIIETTLKRLKYFGVEVKIKELSLFKNNYIIN